MSGKLDAAWDWLLRKIKRLAMELYRANKTQLRTVVDHYIDETVTFANEEARKKIRDAAMRELLERGIRYLKPGAAAQTSEIIETIIQANLKE